MGFPPEFRADILLVDLNPLSPPVPPLGLEVLSDALEKRGFVAPVFSASPFMPDYAQRLDQLKTFRPRAVGLQIRNYDLALLRREHPTVASFYDGVAARLRSWFGDAPLILGGIGFSIDPQFWLSRLKADYGIVGSGELPLTRLLQLLLRGQGSLAHVQNLALPNQRVMNGGADYFPDKLSAVERKYLRPSRWREHADAAGRSLPWANVEISRGCRFRCDFCVEPRVHGRRVIFKEVADVLSEVSALAGAGVREIFFCNSEFNLNLDYCRKLCLALADSGLGEQISWCSYLIPTRLPLALARAMRRAGCRSISFNAVHVNDRILKSFSCPHRRATYETCLDNAEAAGLHVSSTFLVGSALETRETIQELTDFVDRRALRANLSLGIAHYPNLPPSEALDVTHGTKVYGDAGNGTIPYTLRLSDAELRELVHWARPKENVIIQNAPPELLHEQLMPESARRDEPPAIVSNGNVSNGDDGPEEEWYLKLIAQGASVDSSPANAAVETLRRRLPLLDLPEVQLGHETPIPAPAEPSFLLYGPYRRLSLFYRSFTRFLRDPRTDAESVARLLLRLTRCAGEFPRLLDAARPFLDADAAQTADELWREQHSFNQLVFASSYACQSKCPYCYAKDVEREHPGEMTLENFLRALDWAERQRCSVISFVGGEPTLHPSMKEFLLRVRGRGMKTYFNSNLLCAPDVLASFDNSWVINVGIHAQAYRYTRPELRTHFERNVASLREREIYLFLRYNFEYRTREAIDDAVGLARRFGVPQVNFAVPMPSLSRGNRHAVEEELLASGDFLVRAVEAFRAEGLRPVLTKPIPPCAVPEERLEFLRAGEALSPACNLPKRGWTQNVLVGPDLTISPCVGVTSRGPSLLSFGSFEEISRYMVSHLRALVRPTPFPQCHTCNFYVDNRCLGGCLAYFTDGTQPVELTTRRAEELRRHGVSAGGGGRRVLNVL